MPKIVINKQKLYNFALAFGHYNNKFAMNINDFRNQIEFCSSFNQRKDAITVHQLEEFLNNYYKDLLHLKRDLTIAAYSKSNSNKYDFLSISLLQECINSLVGMEYSGIYSQVNCQTIDYIISNCVSALKGIATSYSKLINNRSGITFNSEDEHKSKVLSLKDNALR